MKKEEAQLACPEGIWLIFTNTTVNEYNHSILNCVENKIVSLASDDFVGCYNAEWQDFIRQKLHKKRTDDTDGLLTFDDN